MKENNTNFAHNEENRERTDTDMPSTVEIGREGERMARQLLERKGYQILEQNWHWHHYELDIVARQGDELVIVEVKTRGVDFLVDPEESIDQGKIRRTVAAADAYVRKIGSELPVRFDLVFVTIAKENCEIEHIEDAFMAPCL